MPWWIRFLSPDAPAGGGGTAAAAADPETPKGFDADRAAKSMLREHRGNSIKLIAHLIREGRRYRERIRVQDGELQKRPTVEEGGVVLPKAEAERWTKLKALNLEPEKVQERLALADTLEAQDVKGKRRQRVEQASTALGYVRPGLLYDQLEQRSHHVIESEVDVEKDGKREKEKRYGVRKLDAKDTDPVTPLTQFVDEQLADYKELLTTAPSETRSADDQSQGGGRHFPAQGGTRGRAPKSDQVAQHNAQFMSPRELAERNSRQGA